MVLLSHAQLQRVEHPQNIRSHKPAREARVMLIQRKFRMRRARFD